MFKFNFETIKVPSRIEKIRVAIDVDSDLLLKGKRARVDYRSTSGELTQPQAISSRDLDRIVTRIGAYAPLIKEAKNLSPNETFVVKGEYATNWFRLYLNSILITIFIIASIFLGSYFLTKFLRRNKVKGQEFSSLTNKQTPPQTIKDSISIFSLANLSLSLISVILVIGLTYFLQFILQSDLLRSISFVFTIIGFITIVFMYVLVILFPAIIVVDKYGWKSLASILIAEFLWFVIFVVFYLVLFQSGLSFDSPRPAPPIFD